MIKTRLTERFGIKYPIMSAPMGPFYTTELTIATSEAGGLGVLSHVTLQGKNPIKDMKKQIDRVIEHTDKPFGVNVRVARVQTDHKIMLRKIVSWRKKNAKLREQLQYILTSAGGTSYATGFLQKKDPDIFHAHVTPVKFLAEKAVKNKIDGLVATGTEGGGHQSYEKVATLVLLQELVKSYPNIPIIACGGIASAEGVAGCIAMGADAVAMGTRFIASNESEFHPNYKNLVPPAEDRDTILTTGGFGPIRLIENKYAIEHGKVISKQEKIQQEKAFTIDEYLEDLKHYELVYTEGDVENGAIPVGQSCGLIHEIRDVDDIITKFTKGAEELLKKACTKIS
ncbi:MAG: Nitronate monooxygenase [Promethearchaeota archaeon]|nr:MAG: Nitronate monooxygenase [Candidatus Lokiarchaeota archaeon]